MATYFVKEAGGTGSGLDYSNAWSYAHFLTQTLTSGDIVEIEGTHYGGFTPVTGVTYKKYSGTSTKPTITGLTTLTSWTDEGSGVYSKVVPITVSILNVVYVDGVLKEMGRHPRTGVFPYTANNGVSVYGAFDFVAATQITQSDVDVLPSFVGGDVVLRKYAWVLDRHVITNVSNTTISFQAGTTNNGNVYYQPFNGNGFFIQNHLNTLTVFTGQTPLVGDWYYDPALNKLYMYFGAGNPTSYTIKVATVNSLLTVTSKANVYFEDIIFEGANNNLVNSELTTNNRYTRVTFRGAGWNAISGIGFGTGGDNDENQFINSTFEDCLNQGVLFAYNCNDNIAEGNTFTNISPFPGMTFPGDYGGNALEIEGNNNTFENNIINDAGYCGIAWRGSGNVVEGNTISGYCGIKDDGGAIYTYEGNSPPTRTGNIIRGNILNGTNGALVGKEGYGDSYGAAPAIYMDAGGNGVTITANIIKDSTYAGIYIHDCFDNIITLNRCINNRRGIYFQQEITASTRTNTHTNNIYICKDSGQIPMEIRSSVAESDVGLFFGTTTGSSNNNEFTRPVTVGINIIKVFVSGTIDETVTLADFQSDYLRDANSIGSAYLVVVMGNDFIKRAYEV